MTATSIRTAASRLAALMFFGLLSLSSKPIKSADVNELYLGVPSYQDAATTEFIKVFIEEFASLPIEIVIKEIADENYSALDLLVEGGIDLALVDLEVASSRLREIENARFDLVEFMLLPFLARDKRGLFEVQSDVFGQAVLAQLSNLPVIPLTFWNRDGSVIFANFWKDFSLAPEVDNTHILFGEQVATFGPPATSFALAKMGASLTTIDENDALHWSRESEQDFSSSGLELPYQSAYEISSNYDAAFPNFSQHVGFFAASLERWLVWPQRVRELVQSAAQRAQLKAEEISITEAKRLEDYLEELGVTLVSNADWTDDERWGALDVLAKSYGDEIDLNLEPALTFFHDVTESSPSTEEDRGETVPEIRGDNRTIIFVTDRPDNLKEGSSVIRPLLSERFGSYSEAGVSLIQCAKMVGDMNNVGLVDSRNLTFFTEAACYNLILAETRDSGFPLRIYIHGCCNSFVDAIEGAASVQQLLDDGAPIVVWAWPSGDGPTFYNHDQRARENSGTRLAGFFADFSERATLTRVDMIAHSMGNFLIFDVADAMRQQSMTKQNMVFVAPDVDEGNFETLYLSMDRDILRRSLYATKCDGALLWSEMVNRLRPVGLGGERIISLPNLDSIDTTDVEPSCSGRDRWLGGNHSLVFTVAEARSDLRRLVVDNLDPESDLRGLYKRPNLKGKPYYAIQLDRRD